MTEIPLDCKEAISFLEKSYEMLQTEKEQKFLLDKISREGGNKWIFRTFESGHQESTVKDIAKEMIEKYVELEEQNKNEIVGIEEDFAIKRKNVVNSRELNYFLKTRIFFVFSSITLKFRGKTSLKHEISSFLAV